MNRAQCPIPRKHNQRLAVIIILTDIVGIRIHIVSSCINKQEKDQNYLDPTHQLNITCFQNNIMVDIQNYFPKYFHTPIHSL